MVAADAGYHQALLVGGILMAAAAVIALRIGNTREAAPVVMVNADPAAERGPRFSAGRPPGSSGSCILSSEMTDSAQARRPRPSAGRGKRERLVAAATELLHQQGIERTTLADIAKAADVPLGNVYYYFKTKDDVIAAVIEAQVRQTKATLALIDPATDLRRSD